MANKTIKLSVLGLLLIMFMSVAMATEVTEDTTSEVTIPSIETTDNTVISDENINTYSEDTVEDSTADQYTFANQTLDITGNNYDGQTLTILENVNVTSSNNMQLSNTEFIVSGDNVNITGLKIINSNSKPIVITVTGANVNIKDNNISLYCLEAVETRAITVLNTNNVEISNNTVSVKAVPQAAGWTNETGEWVENMKVSGIKIQNSHDITIDSNVLSLTNSTTTGEYWSTADVITIKNSNDTIISNNDIAANGSDYIYGVSAVNFNNNITVFNNTIQLTGTNYICGVQYSSTSNSKASYNKVNGTCTAISGLCPSYEAFAYGIISITGTYGAATSEATGNIIENNDVTLDSTIAYAYELSNAENNIINNNTANVTGNVVMALGIYNSSNCNITGNTFTVTGNTRDLNSGIYEAISPVTTGIKIVDFSSNILIDSNVILVSDTIVNGGTYCVIVEAYCTSMDVTYNSLTASNPPLPDRHGDETILDESYSVNTEGNY